MKKSYTTMCNDEYMLRQLLYFLNAKSRFGQPLKCTFKILSRRSSNFSVNLLSELPDKDFKCGY